MTTLITLLTEGFADWEVALLSATARGFYHLDVRHAGPGGLALTSAGGMKVLPDLAIEDIELATTDALIVCGGSIWQTPRAPALSGLLRAAHGMGIVVGGVCDGTRALAMAGLLDHTGHTGNSPEGLADTGYAGRANYWDVPHAVSADRIVTAPGTAPVSFMAEIMDALGLADLNLDFYLGLLAAEHRDRLLPPPFPATATRGRELRRARHP